MLEDTPTNPSESTDAIARRGPKGALVLSAVALAIVVAIWFAFYFFAFLPRGMIQ